MDTYGWDTVFATTVEHVNAALAKERGKLLMTFSFDLDGYHMEGAFDPWRVVPGGAGKLLHVELPIVSGKLTAQGKATDLAGISVFVEIALAMLPAPGNAAQRHLRFDVKSDGGASGAVAAVRLKAPPARLGTLQEAVLLKAIPMCLMANAAGITFVFSTVNLLQPGGSSPIAPSQSAFHYVELDAQRAYLSILSVTDQRDLAKLDHKIDPALFVGGDSGYFALASDVMMRGVVQPLLPSIFPGTSSAAFSFNPENHSLQNTGWFQTAPVQSGALWYYPKVVSLLLTPFNDGIACSVTGTCDMGLNITCNFGVHAHNKLVYDAQTQQLSFAKDPNPTVTHDFQIPWYDYLIPGIVGIGDAILALVVDLVANGIADGLQRASAQFSLAREVPQSIRWAGMDAFRIESAAMANAFFMRGTIV